MTIKKIKINDTIHVLYNGDALETLKTFEDNSVNLVVTSPPYADRRKNVYGGVSSDKYVDWFIPFANEIKRILTNDGSFFLNIKPHCVDGERDLYVMKLVIALREQVGLRFVDEFSWTKLGMPGKFKGRFKNAFEPVYHFSKNKDFKHFPYEVATPASDVSLSRYKRKICGKSKNGSGFQVGKEITSKLALPSNHLHITQKSNQHTLQSKHPAVYPVEIPEFFIKAFSEENDIVLDFFSGSGTTSVAASRNLRNSIAIEKCVEYFNLSIERLELEENS
jgi:site-specific DNA-methyltransferase (adenine-specific)/site-specific DNA-methyltransferase (cytosine-N4-specific)